MKTRKLYAADNEVRLFFTVNKAQEEVAHRCMNIIEKLTDVKLSWAVLVRRAIYSLLKELTQTTTDLARAKDVIEALDEARRKETVLLKKLAGRDVFIVKE